MPQERAEQIKHYWEAGPNEPPANKLLSSILEKWNEKWVGASKPHGWEWGRMFPYPAGYEGTLLPGDPTAFDVQTGFLTFPSIIVLEGNWKFGWQHIRALKPDLEQIDPERGLQWWRYGWSPAWEGKERAFLNYCKVNIYPANAITAFESSRRFRVHGIGSDGAEVPLRVSERLHRNDPRYSHLVRF